MLSKPRASDRVVGNHLTRRLDFLDDFVGVVATVHRQLPHDPVSVVVVVGVDGGVQTRPAVAGQCRRGPGPPGRGTSPAVVQQVLDLLGQIGVRERRQEGEGPEHPVGVEERREGKK